MAQAYEVDREKERAKGVEPGGHGEETCDLELHLNKLASVVTRLLSPNLPPTRLGHKGLTCVGNICTDVEYPMATS